MTTAPPPLSITRVELTNVMGHAHLVVETGRVMILRGTNKQGKTSFFEAIRAVFVGGHDASLIRTGADIATIKLTFSNGMTATKTIKPERSDIEVRIPEIGKISNAQTFLRTLVDEPIGVDPLYLIHCPDRERGELLAKIIDVPVSHEEINEAAGFTFFSREVSGLAAIAEAYDELFQKRTGENRAHADATAAAARIKEGLPPEETEPVNLAELRAQRDALAAEIAEEQRKAEEAYTDEERTAANVRTAGVEAVRTNAQGEIEAIRRDVEARIKAIEKERDDAIERVKARAQKLADERYAEEREAIATAQAVRVGKGAMTEEKAAGLAALNEAVTRAEEREKELARTEVLRKAMQENLEVAAKAKAASDALTAGLKRLEKLKAEKMRSTPVQGLEIGKGGKVLVDGLPWNRANTARLFRVCAEIAALRGKKIGLQLIDGAEAITSENLAEFIAGLEAHGGQAFIARAEDGPLKFEDVNRPAEGDAAGKETDSAE